MRGLIDFIRLQCARLELRALGLAHAGSTSALLRIAAARKRHLTATQVLLPAPGHRITLIRPRLLRAPLVITTVPNPCHASALIDMRAMFLTYTATVYQPRRGDVLIHEATK